MSFKYNEDKTLAEVEQYIKTTYTQHYAGEKNNVQLIDLFASNDDAEHFCRTNIVKYVYRYGKKDGYNRKDLLKAMHMLVWLYFFTGDKMQATVPPKSDVKT